MVNESEVLMATISGVEDLKIVNESVCLTAEMSSDLPVITAEGEAETEALKDEDGLMLALGEIDGLTLLLGDRLELGDLLKLIDELGLLLLETDDEGDTEADGLTLALTLEDGEMEALGEEDTEDDGLPGLALVEELGESEAEAEADGDLLALGEREEEGETPDAVTSKATPIIRSLEALVSQSTVVSEEVLYSVIIPEV